ncbi:amidohydrolase family protein [soil metagenome]
MVVASADSATSKHQMVDPAWLALTDEAVIEPDLPIVDTHHHAWDLPAGRYLFDDLVQDFGSGHRIDATVYVQCYSMYRADGPAEMKPVGETEFINGYAAMSASGKYGATRIAAGIVSSADILLGGRIDAVLDAHQAVAGARFKGIRPTTAWHEDAGLRAIEVAPGVMGNAQARAAIGRIAVRGLSLDLWNFFTQADEVADLCRAFPDLTVIVDHCGGPIGIGPYADRQEEGFAAWKGMIARIADCPNAVVKLGGLGMRYAGFGFNQWPAPPSSDDLVAAWGPHLRHCIDSFGPDRCLFESNFPMDKASCSYRVIWNAFKKLTRDFSAAERAAMFSGTARRVYRL